MDRRILLKKLLKKLLSLWLSKKKLKGIICFINMTFFYVL